MGETHVALQLSAATELPMRLTGCSKRQSSLNLAAIATLYLPSCVRDHVIHGVTSLTGTMSGPPRLSGHLSFAQAWSKGGFSLTKLDRAVGLTSRVVSNRFREHRFPE